MDVYVIPLGGERYELYCEHAGDPEPVVEEPSSGLFGRLWHRFATLLRDAEARRHQSRDARSVDRSWMTRAQERMMAWVAERIAEQRLLWNLRHENEVTLAHPADMTFADVRVVLDRVLKRDYDRHFRWLVIDSILAAGSAALAVLPGPNFVFYYFAFRLVGHWLSMQGARQGLRRIAWVGRTCAPLAELRNVGTLQGVARTQFIEEVSARLQLQHLTTFFDRVAI